MSNKQKYYIGLFLVLLIVCNVVGVQITQGLLNQAYKPYKGVVVVLDAGHGGRDDGARYNSVKEQEVNLLISKYVKKELEDIGMKVILTRDSGKDLAKGNTKNRKREDMKERVKIINDEKVDFFISIHMNAFPTSTPKGSQIFYAKKDEDSYQFASCIQEAIASTTNTKSDPKVGNYYILNKSNKIGVLLECGFLSNPQDREKLITSKYQKQLSKDIKKGVMTFLQNVYE